VVTETVSVCYGHPMTYTEPRTVAIALRADRHLIDNATESLGFSDVVEQVIRASWDLARVAQEMTYAERDLIRAEKSPYSRTYEIDSLRGRYAACVAIYKGAAA